MEALRYHDITFPSYTNGPGQRVALFVQGCSIRCEHCQSPHLWPASGGRLSSADALAACLLETEAPITITGGEPTDQPRGLLSFLLAIRRRDSRRHVILYTGRTFEELVAQTHPARYALDLTLRLVHVLVDGPYMPEHDHDGMQYRGSANQRVIDLVATLQRRTHDPVALPVLLDWDTPEVILTPDGLLGTPHAMRMIGADATAQPARRCGQSLDP